MGDGLNDAGGNGGIIYDLGGIFPANRNARLYTSGSLNIVNLVSGTDAIYCSGSPHPTTPPSPSSLDLGYEKRYYTVPSGPSIIAGSTIVEIGYASRTYNVPQGPELIYGPITLEIGYASRTYNVPQGPSITQ